MYYACNFNFRGLFMFKICLSILLLSFTFMGCGIDEAYESLSKDESSSSGPTITLSGNEAIYTFDTLEGTTAKNSGFDAYHGEITNAASVSGKVNNALDFNLDGPSYVELALEAGLTIDFPENHISIDTWINFTSLDSNYHLILGNGGLGVQSFKLFIDQGKLNFRLEGYEPVLIITSNQTFNTNEWYHIALTYDANTAIVYINGVQDNTRNVINSVDQVWNTLYIGGVPGYNNASFPGLIDEMHLTARIKSADEIASYYNARK